MTPFAPMEQAMQAAAGLWSDTVTAMLDAQDRTARAVSDSMQAMAGWFGQDVGWPRYETGLGTITVELAAPAEQPWSWPLPFSAMPGLLGAGVLEDALAHVVGGPRLADLWGLERLHMQAMKAWVDVQRRSLEHQTILLEAWVRAGQRYLDRAARHCGPDGPPRDHKQALQLWTEVANGHLLDTQHSRAFLDSQRNVIRANNALRVAQQGLAEYFGKQFGTPTRTELDDVHRSLTEMRREVRRIARVVQ